MHQDRRTHRLMVTVIVLLVLVLLSLFVLIGVVVLSKQMEPTPEEALPRSSQAAPEEPEEPARPEEPELPAESSREEQSSDPQVIAPVQPQPVVKPQVPAPASSSSSQPKEESSSSGSPEYPGKTYEKGGYYDSKQKLGNVSIKAGNIILENKTITGRLTIAKNTEGTIELVDCVVEGPLYIRGGETLVLTDSRVSEIFVMEGYGREITLVADSESRSGRVTAYTSAVLDESTLDSSGKGFSDLKVASGDPVVYVTLVNTVLTRAILEEKAYLYIDGGSLISRLRVNKPTMIHGEGEIELLTIASDNITSYIIPDEEEKTKNRFDDVAYLEYSTALAKPTGLAVAYTGSGFRLSWNAAAHATGYRVEMTATGLSYSKSQSGTAIAVGDDFIGKSTTFKVQATTTQAGYSAGEWATLTFTPKQVGDITGFDVKGVDHVNKKVELVWNAAANAESYSLTYQKNGAGTATSINDLTGTTATVTLSEAGTYTFTLKSVGAANTKPAAVPVSTVTYTIS